MTPKEFVEAIRTTVHDAAIRGTQSNLKEPPGRRPSASDVALSTWFNGLSAQDRDNVVKVIRHSVHSALFGLFCVLDGVRAIDDDPNATLQLFYENSDSRGVLNSKDDLLHDIYQSLVYEEVFEES
jgi:hypothetical protein